MLLIGACVSVAACVGDNSGVTSGDSDAGSDTGTGVETGSGSGDASPIDANGDAGVVAPACDLTKPFGSPQLVAGLEGVGAVRLSPDERTAYVYLTPDGGTYLDVYFATRADRNAAFGSPTAFAFNSMTDNDYVPTVSGDGLTMIFLRGTPSPDFDLYISQRGSTAAQFLTASPLVGPVNTSKWESSPYLRPDGQVLYFGATVAGAGSYHVSRSVLVGGSFGAAVPVAELNTSGNDDSAVVTADDLTIFWASDRQDLSPKGGFDVYTASRATPTDPFSNIRNVAEVNTNGTESPTWVSPDGCRLYLSKSGGPGALMATRPR